MAGPADNDTFAVLLSKASAIPEVATGDGQDLPDGFPLKKHPHHRVVDTKDDPTGVEGTVAFDFSCKRAVFVIFKPWHTCKRCLEATGIDPSLLPADGEYVCPHTQLAEYQAMVDRGLAGQSILAPEAEYVQRDGSILVSTKWYEKKLRTTPLPSTSTRAAAAAAAIKASSNPPMQQDEPDL
jgi:hypothetical protein